MLFRTTTVGDATGSCRHLHETGDAARECLADARRHYRRVGLACDRILVETLSADELPPPRISTDSLLDRLLVGPVGEWRMMVGTIIVNRWSPRDGLRLLDAPVNVVSGWPRPELAARAGLDLDEIIGDDRASNVRRFSAWWFRCGWAREKRWLPAPSRLIEAPGVDVFGREAYRLLVAGGDPDPAVDDHALRAYAERSRTNRLDRTI